MALTKSAPKPGAPKAAPTKEAAKKPAPAARRREYQRVAGTLKMASDGTRLRILLMLDEQEMNVGAMCVAVGGMSQPAVSHHLSLLRAARLVEPRRDGKNNVYSLTDQGRELSRTAAAMTGVRS